MLVERVNEAAALAALNLPMVSTRLCISIKPEDTIFRFTNDTSNITVGGKEFVSTPYMQFSDINSGGGRSADTMTVTLDGAHIVNKSAIEAGVSQLIDQALLSIVSLPLRDRPVQCGTIVLNVETGQPIGLIPDFVGFVDGIPFNREKDEGGSGSSRLDMNIASFRAFSQRQYARVYSETDHLARFPLDRCARWISDAVFRNSKYPWNETSATSTSTSASPGYNPYGPGFRGPNVY